jgi:hypothetical protein
MALEFVTALVLRASQKSLLNKVGDFCNWFHSIISSLAELSSNCIATIL